DRTLISPRALAAAGVSLSRPVGTGQVHGLTGSDRMDFVIVNSIEIGDARGGRLPVGSHEMAHGGGGGLRRRGLLGRGNRRHEGAGPSTTAHPTRTATSTWATSSTRCSRTSW